MANKDAGGSQFIATDGNADAINCVPPATDGNADAINCVPPATDGNTEVKRRRHATKPGEARFARIAREGRAFRTGTSDEPRFRAASGVETAKFGRDRGRSRTQMIQARRFAAGLRPEANLMIAERSHGLANRPHQFIEYGCLVSRPSLVRSRGEVVIGSCSCSD